jgi:RNA polymerase nonessential primary-like sigma factor
MTARHAPPAHTTPFRTPDTEEELADADVFPFKVTPEDIGASDETALLDELARDEDAMPEKEDMADFIEDVTCLYLSEIGVKPLLTPEEERDYARRARAGDFAARQIMIERNLRLVIKIARRYLHWGIPLLDLVEEGNLGLMRALDKFDPERGFRFTTYATWWIRQAVDLCVMMQARAIRLPVNIHKEILRIQKALRHLAPETSREEAMRQVASRLGKSTEEIRRILGMNENATSLSTPLENNSNYSLGDFIAGSAGDDPETRLQQVERTELVEKCLGRLNARQREIVERRYGLSGREPETLDAISRDMNLTRERVRQIQLEAIRQLQRMLLASGIQPETIF